MFKTKINTLGSGNFKTLVYVALIATLGLGMMSLYTFTKFYETFESYKQVSENEKKVITLSRHFLLREALIHRYLKTGNPENVDRLSSLHTKIVEGFESLQGIDETSDIQGVLEAAYGKYQDNMKALEPLFELNTTLMKIQRKKLALERVLLAHLQELYDRATTTNAVAGIENLMNTLLHLSYRTNMHLLSHQPLAEVEKQVADIERLVSQVTTRYPEVVAGQQKKLTQEVKAYDALTETFNETLRAYTQQRQAFENLNLLGVEATLVDLEMVFFEEQKNLHDVWYGKMGYFWQLAITIILLTIVLLGWFVILLTQLFMTKSKGQRKL